MAEKKESEVTPQVPEMVKITFNNNEFEVPKEAAEKIKEYEHYLGTEQQTKAQTVMQEAKAYRQKVEEWRAADVKFYSTTPREAWEHYVPLVQNEGQGGYKGDPILLTQKEETDPIYNESINPKPKSNAMETNPILTELEAVRKETADIKLQLERQNAGKVRDTVKRLLNDPKYNMGKEKEVMSDVVDYYNRTGTHASEEVIKGYLKASHDSTMELNKSRGEFVFKPRSEGLPQPGNLPREPLKNLPKLKDTSKVAQYAADFLLGKR